MPTYGYQCAVCKFEFTVFQSMKDDPISTCPECGGVVKRLLYPVGIVFKGSGWYINDSRKPDPADKPEETKSEKSSDKTSEPGKSGDSEKNGEKKSEKGAEKGNDSGNTGSSEKSGSANGSSTPPDAGKKE